MKPPKRFAGKWRIVETELFDVQLPITTGTLEFAAFHWGRGYAIAPAPGVTSIVPAVA